MDKLNNYEDVVIEVRDELLFLTEKALEIGVPRENIIWDPGLGFAKDTTQNLKILNCLNLLKANNFPLLIGPSRKRFIGEILEEKSIEGRIWGTAAVACKCVQEKVSFIRVHDVAAISKVVKMANKLWP